MLGKCPNKGHKISPKTALGRLRISDYGCIADMVKAVSTLTGKKEENLIQFIQLYSMFSISASFEVPDWELVKDLVFVFQGVDGKWVKFQSDKDGYKVDPQVSSYYSWLCFPLVLFLTFMHALKKN